MSVCAFCYMIATVFLYWLFFSRSSCIQVLIRTLRKYKLDSCFFYHTYITVDVKSHGIKVKNMFVIPLIVGSINYASNSVWTYNKQRNWHRLPMTHTIFYFSFRFILNHCAQVNKLLHLIISLAALSFFLYDAISSGGHYILVHSQ